MLLMIELHEISDFLKVNTELQIFREYETCSPDTWTVTHSLLDQ